MKLHSLKSVFIILGSIVFSFHANCIKPDGYRAVISYKEGFIAAGSDGRIDWISLSGRILKTEKFPGEKLNTLLYADEMLIAGGDFGLILVSASGAGFKKVESGTTKNIRSLTLFKGLIIAGTDDGGIISWDGKGNFRKNQVAVKGNIVSVSARISDLYGVTDEGEIIHSTDGVSWNISDFNKVYSGYYKPCYFTKVLLTDNRIAVVGYRNDGSAALYLSTQGTVWTERSLNYTDETGATGYLEDTPNDISYDATEDQLFIACNKGKLISIPSCAHCNRLMVVSASDLSGIAVNGDTVLVAGDDFFIRSVTIR